MQGQVFVCLLGLIVLRQSSVQAFSNTYLCTQEGSTFSHECTVNDNLGIGSTIWQGDILKCVDRSNQIALPHSQYESGVLVVCGDFSAVSVRVSGSEYTSRLTINGHGSNEVTINCTLSGSVVVETIYVRFGSKSIIFL